MKLKKGMILIKKDGTKLEVLDVFKVALDIPKGTKAVIVKTEDNKYFAGSIDLIK